MNSAVRSLNEQYQGLTLVERISNRAQMSPQHEAIVSADLRLTYQQLLRALQVQINLFGERGISSDSVVGIRCSDEAKHLVLCIAATYKGATTFTVPTHESEQTQDAMIESCNSTHVVDETWISELTPEVESLSSGMTLKAETDARFLFSTSGTTGKPKLVVHHDSDLVAQAHRHVDSDRERFACVASIEQNFAKRHRLYCVAMGATNVFLQPDQKTLVTQCHSLDVNVLHVSAFQSRELLALPDIGSLSGIRLKLGGSHVPLPLRQELRQTITPHLQAGYGTTETGAIGFTDPQDLDAGESVGRPLPGIEVRTVSPERAPLGSGERGELAIRCQGMFRGYLGNEELTRSRLESEWFYTGDIGYLDEQKRIHLCGRADDMFLFNSMNIYPQDIESQICEHPDVVDAAVIPKQSSTHGNIPVALVAVKEKSALDLKELKQFVRKKTGVRCPRQFTLVSSIPRNATGKIARGYLLVLYNESDQVRQSIVQALSDACASDPEKLSLLSAFEQAEGDVRFSRLQIDSLARMELMIVLEVEHD
ncbi:MAG: class I adenylate-forming enzyme family protein, partial [Pseudomonadota bacterium]